MPLAAKTPEGWIEPLARAYYTSTQSPASPDAVYGLSQAISAKRTADALESIARSLALIANPPVFVPASPDDELMHSVSNIEFDPIR